MTDDEYMHLITAVGASHARGLARRYPNIGLDVEDMAQEIAMYGWKNRAKLWKFTEGETAEERKELLAQLGKALFRAGDRSCRKTKAKLAGYKPGDEFFYDQGLVEAVLPQVFDRAAWSGGAPPSDDGAPRRSIPPSEGGNFLATVVDVDRALGALSEYDVKVLRARFGGYATADEPLDQGGRTPWRRVAPLLGVDGHEQARRHGIRAVDRLLLVLGGASPWEGTGSRRVRSNSSAQGETRRQV